MRRAPFLFPLFALAFSLEAFTADRVPDWLVLSGGYECPNHLVPVLPFSDELTEKKLKVSPGMYGAFLSQPSFSGEMRVAVDEADPKSDPPPEGEYRIVVTQAESSLWFAAKVKEGVRPEVKVTRTEAWVDGEFALAIHKAWSSFILKTRYPRKAAMMTITDGTGYQGSVWVQGYGTIYGRTHSPDVGLPKEFVEIGETLAEYPSAKPGDRPAIRAKLLKRLKSLESQASRM